MTAKPIKPGGRVSNTATIKNQLHTDIARHVFENSFGLLGSALRVSSL